MTCFLNIVFRWIIVPILAFLVSYSFCLIEIRWRIRIKRNARKDIDDTIRVRKELIRLRTAFGRVARILCLAATVIAIAYVGGNYNGLLSIMPVFIALAAFRLGFSWVWGKVSTKKAQDILAQTEPFILYLRAFESDFYSKDPKAYSLSKLKIDCVDKNNKLKDIFEINQEIIKIVKEIL